MFSHFYSPFLYRGKLRRISRDTKNAPLRMCTRALIVLRGGPGLPGGFPSAYAEPAERSSDSNGSATL